MRITWLVGVHRLARDGGIVSDSKKQQCFSGEVRGRVSYQ